MSTNRNHRCSQWNRAHLWDNILNGPASVIVGQCHKRSMLIASTEDVSARQWFAKMFITLDMTSLIKQAIQSLFTRRMWVNKNVLIALSYDLGMVSRNDQF